MDAEAVLAQYQRAKAALAGPSQRRPPVSGRRLDEAPNNAAPSRASADTEAAMKWMESRLDALAAEVAAAPSAERSALPSGRRASRDPAAQRGRPHAGRPPPSGSGAPTQLTQLAELEAASREQASRLRAECEHVAALRERLRAFGFGEDEASIPASATTSSSSAAASAAVPTPAGGAEPSVLLVRPARGGESGAGGSRRDASACGTSASELEAAASRRVTALRRQNALGLAALDAIAAERLALERAAEARGVAVAVAAPGGSGRGSGRASPHDSSADRGAPHPRAFLAQLHRLDGALRARPTPTPGGSGGGSGGARPGGGRPGGGRGRARAGAGGIHTLANAGPPLVPLTVFADGFMLLRGPFRPFARAADAPPALSAHAASSAASASLVSSSVSAGASAAFVHEVMAGCVPTELEASHPGGFALELHDCCGCTHGEAHAEATRAYLSRAGRTGRGAEGAACLGNVPSGVAALLAPQGADALLKALPSSVVNEGGSIVPVRSELAAVLGRREAAPQLASSAGGADGGSGAEAADEQRRLAEVRAARLRRFEQGA